MRRSRLVSCCVCRVQDELARVKAEGAQKARLLHVVTEWNSQHEARVERLGYEASVLQQVRARQIQRQRTRRAEAERIKRLPAQDVMAMSDRDIQHAFDVEGVQTTRANFEHQCQIRIAPLTIHPAITFMQQLNEPVLLSSLTPELKQQLQQFLGAVKLNVSRTTYDAAWARCRTNIVGCSRFGCVMRSSSVCDAQDYPKLLYKATRDGFSPAAFFRHVAQQGPTLMLIKVGPCKQTFNVSEYCASSHIRESHCILIAAVTIRQAAGTGYVFGAYTAVDWPNQPARGTPSVNVPDPSGAPFMFSLINEYQRPFRMSLVDHTRAVSVYPGFGPMFGGELKDADGKTVKFCNLMLMFNGKDAYESGGNCANPHTAGQAYQLDAWAGAPPVGFKLDATTLAGAQYFAAAEIECYSL
jgi:hypothetical protein